VFNDKPEEYDVSDDPMDKPNPNPTHRGHPLEVEMNLDEEFEQYQNEEGNYFVE
jgi:hypothetical protein